MFVIEDKVVAQGDMQMVRIAGLPKDVVPSDAEGGCFILTHSESGHHHVVLQQPGVEFYADAKEPTRAYLVVNNPKETCFVEHRRQHDTHAPYEFKDGVYEIRRQIESFPEGFRRALD